jgi:hypothetical protein
MSDREGVITRLVARVRALLPEDWFGRAGERLNKTTEAISDFAEEHHVRPTDILEETVELGHRKLEGLANKEYAAAAKDFAEVEQKKIETELQRRTVDIRVRKEEAETRLAELKALDAEIELLRKMKEIGVVLHRDESGNLTVLPPPANCDLLELVERRRLTAAPADDPHLDDSQVFSRPSRALEQFFVYLQGQAGLSILDLAGASQENINFITNLGHRLYSEDFVRSLDDIFGGEDQTNANRIDQFLRNTLSFEKEQFDGVLVWDVLQYMKPALLAATLERLRAIVRPQCYLLAYYHSDENAEQVPFYSFQIKDRQNILLSQRGMRKPAQIFNNRSLEKLFQEFDSVKFFLTREQLREVIVKR